MPNNGTFTVIYEDVSRLIFVDHEIQFSKGMSKRKISFWPKFWGTDRGKGEKKGERRGKEREKKGKGFGALKLGVLLKILLT